MHAAYGCVATSVRSHTKSILHFYDLCYGQDSTCAHEINILWSKNYYDFITAPKMLIRLEEWW